MLGKNFVNNFLFFLLDYYGFLLVFDSMKEWSNIEVYIFVSGLRHDNS